MSNDLLNIPEQEWVEYKANLCIEMYQKGLEFPAWSDARAKWWYESLLFFVDEFIQPEFPRPEFHNDWYYWSVRYQSYMNLSPRDHAKTTVHSVIRVVWEICVNRNITFLINLATMEVAKIVLGQIKSQLTQNPRIRAGFGAFNPMELPPEERTVEQDWSQSSITVNRPDFTVKDPTVAVIGSLTNVLSRRADRLIQDDILNDQIAFSEAESERLERWRINDVVPVLKSDGQEIITGTPYRKGDFYHGLMEMSLEKGGEYHVFIGDAIIDETQQTTLWPERWPYDKLMQRRRKMGTVRFNRNYRCRITSDEDSPFPMIWFTGGVDKTTGAIYPGCYDNSLTLGTGPRRLRPEERWLRFSVIGVDPAIGVTKKAKYFCAIVLGIDYSNHLVIAEIVRGKFTFPAQKRIVIGLNEKWRPSYVVVENNSYQQALLQGIGEEPESAVIPLVPWHTGSKKTRPDIGVPAMDVYFETGRFKIPRADVKSKELTDLLIEELHYWGRSETSDMAMSLWFGFERIKNELLKSGAVKAIDDMVYGDRLRYEQQKVMGLSGQPVPRKALAMIRAGEFGPLRHLSPISQQERQL